VNQQPDLPVSITSARPSRSSDIRRRQTRYLFSMAIRTVCFVLAVVTSGPLRWTLVAGAVFLPYVAVVLANATDRRSAPGPASFAAEDRPLLEPAPEPASRPDQAEPPGRENRP
jgi:hypothetical protein